MDNHTTNNEVVEEWRAIPGFESMYEASTLGRVRSLDRDVPMKNGVTKTLRGRILKPQLTPGGYHIVTLSKDNVRHQFLLHRLILTVFQGESPGLECCHNDGDRINNKLSNLRWDTKAANAQDRLAHGNDHNASKTHCIHGHEYTPDNTYHQAGGRACRTCAIGRSRARYRTRNIRTRDALDHTQVFQHSEDLL